MGGGASTKKKKRAAAQTNASRSEGNTAGAAQDACTPSRHSPDLDVVSTRTSNAKLKLDTPLGAAVEKYVDSVRVMPESLYPVPAHVLSTRWDPRTKPLVLNSTQNTTVVYCTEFLIWHKIGSVGSARVERRPAVMCVGQDDAVLCAYADGKVVSYGDGREMGSWGAEGGSIITSIHCVNDQVLCSIEDSTRQSWIAEMQPLGSLSQVKTEVKGMVLGMKQASPSAFVSFGVDHLRFWSVANSEESAELGRWTGLPESPDILTTGAFLCAAQCGSDTVVLGTHDGHILRCRVRSCVDDVAWLQVHRGPVWAVDVADCGIVTCGTEGINVWLEDHCVLRVQRDAAAFAHFISPRTMVANENGSVRTSQSAPTSFPLHHMLGNMRPIRTVPEPVRQGHIEDNSGNEASPIVVGAMASQAPKESSPASPGNEPVDSLPASPPVMDDEDTEDLLCKWREWTECSWDKVEDTISVCGSGHGVLVIGHEDGSSLCVVDLRRTVRKDATRRHMRTHNVLLNCLRGVRVCNDVLVVAANSATMMMCTSTSAVLDVVEVASSLLSGAAVFDVSATGLLACSDRNDVHIYADSGRSPLLAQIPFVECCLLKFSADGDYLAVMHASGLHILATACGFATVHHVAPETYSTPQNPRLDFADNGNACYVANNEDAVRLVTDDASAAPGPCGVQTIVPEWMRDAGVVVGTCAETKKDEEWAFGTADGHVFRQSGTVDVTTEAYWHLPTPPRALYVTSEQILVAECDNMVVWGKA